MNSEDLQRVWELIAEKAERENDPQKHIKLIDELLRGCLSYRHREQKTRRTTIRHEKRGLVPKSILA
jgi:hypothetical protein